MRPVILALACIWLAVPLRAEGLERLMQALRFDETIAIMQEEGLHFGAQMGEDMLAPSGRDAWARSVARVYDAEDMGRILRVRFADAMAGVDPAPLITFFEGQGAELVALELAARRALLDEETETMAQARYDQMAGEGAALVARIEALIDDSDLVERNLAGILNSNLAFYRGLAQGAGRGPGEAEMLADLWAQEAELRAETRDWLTGFMTIAYAPLSSEVLDAYTALWRSAAGRALNEALFVAFHAMNEANSQALGRAVAMQMQGEDL